MIILMIITLYTSRKLLEVLGVDDFGVFSIVGSITATFYTLRTVFAEAIQRFLNYEKGGGSILGERQIFSISIILHVAIALIFIILSEILGTWLLEHKLIIAPDRFQAACFTFHMTIVASMFYILLVPYDAVIIANEKMSVYAWVSILDGVGKLLIVFMLPLIHFDKLETYSLLLVIIPLINLVVYSIYCRKFPECQFSFKIKKDKVFEIFSFSGWSFTGNLFYTFAHEGLNVLINMFGGTVYNASRNIAYQVKSAVNQVANNTLLATKPFILQSAAKSDASTLLFAIVRILRANFFIMLLTCIPLITFCETFLTLWLKDVPLWSLEFSQLAVFSVLIRSMHGPLDMFYMGMGNIKKMVIIESSIFILFLIVSYILLSIGLPITSAFLALCITEVLIILALSANIKLEFRIDVTKLFFSGILPCIILSCISLLVYYTFVKLWVSKTFVGIVGGILLCCMIEMVLILLFMNKEEKETIKNFLHNKIKH